MTSFKSEQIPYSQTAAFSAIVTGYLAGSPDLKPFYAHFPDIEGVKNSIAQRRNFATNRSLLVTYLKLNMPGWMLQKKFSIILKAFCRKTPLP